VEGHARTTSRNYAVEDQLRVSSVRVVLSNRSPGTPTDRSLASPGLIGGTKYALQPRPV